MKVTEFKILDAQQGDQLHVEAFISFATSQQPAIVSVTLPALAALAACIRNDQLCLVSSSNWVGPNVQN